MTPEQSTRFWAKVHVTESCWLWTASVNHQGYGKFGLNGRPRYAHRIAYETCVGPVPLGFELDHLCRTRACVNPDHMEPVTHRENVLRGEGITAQQVKRTSCPSGHPYTEANTHVSATGKRRCRTCDRISKRTIRAQHAMTGADVKDEEGTG